MPDVHAGIGATVGSVIATRGAIIPAAVGVDIGCGMNAVRLSLSSEQLPDNLARVRAAIERAVPVGFDEHREAGARREACTPLARGLAVIVRKHPKIAKMQRDHEKKWIRQMGSLGGGNHFIELCLDEAQHLWVMLHSGSRGIGNCIGQYFIAAARDAMMKTDVHLPDRDLAWLAEGSRSFEDYVEAVGWAQDYAFANRGAMLEMILQALHRHLQEHRPGHGRPDESGGRGAPHQARGRREGLNGCRGRMRRAPNSGKSPSAKALRPGTGGASPPRSSNS